MSTKDGGAAFPVHGQRWDRDNGPDQVEFPGMSLRDYFAAKAMAALIQCGAEISIHTPDGVLVRPARVGIPPVAYEYADAMLAERAK